MFSFLSTNLLHFKEINGGVDSLLVIKDDIIGYYVNNVEQINLIAYSISQNVVIANVSWPVKYSNYSMLFNTISSDLNGTVFVVTTEIGEIRIHFISIFVSCIFS